MGHHPVCFVMDNCRVHDREELPDRIGRAGHELKFLLPYRPMLNPIQEVMGGVKRIIRSLLSVDFHDEVLAIEGLRWGLKTAVRRELLRKALDQAMAGVTVETVDYHSWHSFGFLEKAIRREKI
jgi:hypothetical protein